MVCGFAVAMDYSTRRWPRASRREERFVDLSPATMSLLDRLVLKHNFDTDHLFVVLKKDARDKTGRSTYGQPLNCHALVGSIKLLACTSP